ncbi:MAG: HlyC/CorC family transporter [Phycisphaerae bacterium]|nr:HlyC/CorC family transporter [Phycisphaerae bacterium]
MDPALWVAVAAAILSGFFALSSFSLRSFSRARLEELLGSGRKQRRLASLDTHLEAMRLTLTLCRSLANLVLVAAVVHLFCEDILDWTHLAAAVGVAGGVIAVLSVGIPHAWADAAAEKILAVVLPILLVVRFIFSPVVLIMRVFDVPIRRLSGHREKDEDEAAKQEILQAASEGQAEGAVDADEVDMIESVMEFGDTDAAEIMTPRTDMFALPAETPWAQAAAQIHQAGHTRVPVYRENLDDIIGILYAKDLLQHVGKDDAPTLESLVRKPYFVPETKPLDDLLREFKSRKVHLAIVLDEYGGTAGLVSIEDVLEEIVGEISDEYDRAEEQQVRRINETTLEVDGRLRVDELNDELDLELPEDEDYDTVAGFAVAELGYIPHSGETFTAQGAEFTIQNADERKITKLRVKKLPDEDDEE